MLPLIFSSGGSLTSFSLIGIAIIFALSYNILLGQTGLLSFGHAVHYGLGGFLAVHAMNAVASRNWPIPLPFIPLVGGLGGLAFAVVSAGSSTKRAGTVFAMISLGIGELVASSSLILRSVFGGESGITTDRTALPHLFGWSFGPQLQVYYLIAFWLMISAIAMYALTRTPLGRICNAVRDNPERVEFIGYDPHVVRYLAYCFAGFFAGVAGGLAAINFEIANSAYLGATQSGLVLFAAFIGGTAYFFGPILGAILVTYLQLGLTDVTPVWQLYFGIIFIGVVMFAPGGIAGLLMMHRPLIRAGIARHGDSVLSGRRRSRRWRWRSASMLAIETVARYTVNRRREQRHQICSAFRFDATSPITWAVAAVLVVGGFLVARLDLAAGRRGLGPRPRRSRGTGGISHDRRHRTVAGRREEFRQTCASSATSTSASRKGERHAIIGPNGAGKSTTFNLISGYITPSSGEIRLNGDVISGLRPYRDQPARAVALVPGHQRVRQDDGLGERPLRRAVGDRPSLRVLEERRPSAGGARAHRARCWKTSISPTAATCRRAC